ncbi:MAG: hypothetical protein OEZ36_04905, partial [Spirochaetota bacterium]|nr:hypothetical protein [Spirochaetota bacterium]
MFREKILSLFLTLIIIQVVSGNKLFSEIKLKEPAIIYKIRGDHYRRVGLYDKALNEYEKATYIKQEYPECYYWSAVIYNERQLYTQALYEIKYALRYLKKVWQKDFNKENIFYDILFLEVRILKNQIYQENESNKEIRAEQSDKEVLNRNDVVKRKLHVIENELLKIQNELGRDFKPYLQYQLGRVYYNQA